MNFELYNIKEIPKLPNTMHGKHALILNSGFNSKELLQKVFLSSEKKAQDFFHNIGEDLNSEGMFWKILNDEIEKHTREFSSLSNNYNASSAPFFSPGDVSLFHGSGTIYEYALLTKLRGYSVLNLTIHESREGLLKYTGEPEALKDVPRGGFIVNIIADIRNKITVYEQELGIAINLCLEHENFTILRDDVIDGFKDKRDSWRNSVDTHILSTHWMLKGKNDNIFGGEGGRSDLRFIDGDISNIADLLDSYESFENLICAYVGHQLKQVTQEGKPNYVLGHPSLIVHKLKAFIQNSRFTEDDLKKSFQTEKVKMAYLALFKEVIKKDMLIDINISKAEANGTGFYEEWILHFIKESGVKVTIGSDSHSLLNEFEARDVWMRVSEILIDAGITEVYQLVFRDESMEINSA